MFSKTTLIFAGIAATLLAASASGKEKKSAKKMTDTQKIALAVSAGPAAITKDAAVVDMMDMSSHEHKQLRAGTNGWVCYAMENTPMCLDKEWQTWAEAWMGKTEPKINGTGIAYMLRGDNGASNTDPYATAPTPDNQWVITPSHIMALYQDRKLLDFFPTDPKNGGPWVMWKGTPYAHVMVPVAPKQAPNITSK